MGKLIKNIVLVLTLIIGINFNVSAKQQLFYNKVNVQALAAFSSTTSFDPLPAKDNVSLDKIWTIKFTSEVTMDKIDGIVIQKDSQFIPVTINIISNDSITVKPVNFYEKGTKYSLKLFLSNGKKRSMDFTTEGSTTNNTSTVNSIVDVNLNQFKVIFNSKIDKDSAEDVTNYQVDGMQLTPLDDNHRAVDGNGAIAKAIDDNTVMITLATPRKQFMDILVAVKKSILTADKNDTIDEFEQTVNFSDIMPPTVKSVTVKGNSQLTVEFSEAVNMKTIDQLKSKFKIDGQSIANYGVNATYSEIKDCVNVSYESGSTGIWANEVVFYFDSPITSGSHTLTISDGDSNGLLSDAAGFTVKKLNQYFSVDTITTKPVVKFIKETSSGEVHITFDRPMDVQTAEDPSNWELNGRNLYKSLNLTASNFYTDDNHATIKITGLGKGIVTGANVMYIKNNIKDVYGNKVADDTRVSFEDVEDETKPTVLSTTVIDSQTVQVRFSKDVDYRYVENTSNYELLDNKNLDITDHIDKIVSYKGDNDTSDTDTYKIKIKRFNPNYITDDWRLTGDKYTLTIKNIADTTYTRNVMDEYTTTFNGYKKTENSGNDKTKPTVNSATEIDNETICVKFNKNVNTINATNISNYWLKDINGVDITNHIDKIVSAAGDTFYIKLKKYNPNNVNEDWRLTSANYTLVIKNIIDTATTPNTMDDYTATLNASEVAPKATGIYANLRGYSSDKDKVIIYFSEAMDTATLTNKDNYKFINGEGDTKSLPGDADVSVGGDNKSAIIEFPSSYRVLTGGKITNGITNDVTAVIVANVKDEAGNILDGVAFNNNNRIDQVKVGAQVKDNTIKTYYAGEDLKVDVQFDKAIDLTSAADFTLGGVTPSSIGRNGSLVTLTFKDGSVATMTDITNAGTITCANGKTNRNPTKIELVKGQGQNAKLAISSTGTTDETGAFVSRNDDGSIATLSNTQAGIYDYQAAPRTTCFDNNYDNPDFWTATKDANGGKIYVTFDTPLDTKSEVKLDDITFTGLNGTDLKADAVSVDGNTVVFKFNTNNKNYSAFAYSLNIAVKDSISLRTQKDAHGNNASYVPSSDDIKIRTLTVNDSTPVTPAVGAVELSTVTCTNPIDNFSTAVTFKLNVTDPQDYTVVLKGRTATYNAASGLFVVMIDSKVAVSDLTTGDFVVKHK